MPSSDRGPRGTRLFVPLNSEPFQWFRSGKKRWELRRIGRQFSLAHVRLGRDVELRRGYSDAATAIWGTIARVVTASSLEEFFERVPFSQVVPSARSQAQAVKKSATILGVG